MPSRWRGRRVFIGKFISCNELFFGNNTSLVYQYDKISNLPLLFTKQGLNPHEKCMANLSAIKQAPEPKAILSASPRNRDKNSIYMHAARMKILIT
jgi:hypothetical protein